jgi:hypothetical protein
VRRTRKEVEGQEEQEKQEGRSKRRRIFTPNTH